MPQLPSREPQRPAFQREGGSSKPDRRGRVVVKVFLLDEGKPAASFPVNGNRKEEVIVADATVGQVYEAIQQALFGTPTA